MRALDLELVRRRPVWPAWLLLAVGGLLFGDALLDTLRLRDELSQWERRRGITTAASPALQEPVNEQTRRELDLARQALQELALPWDPLFKAIETSIGADNALLAIEPDAGKRVLRINGEARSYPSILGFMVRLEQTQVLTGVHLISHQLREDVAQRPVQYTLAASWRTAP